MAKQKSKQTATQKKKEKEVTIKPKLSEFIGKKLSDVSKEKGKTILHFSNGYKLKLTGDVHLEGEEK
jgi:ribosomal protein S6E (S10)